MLGQIKKACVKGNRNPPKFTGETWNFFRFSGEKKYIDVYPFSVLIHFHRHIDTIMMGFSTIYFKG